MLLLDSYIAFVPGTAGEHRHRCTFQVAGRIIILHAAASSTCELAICSANPTRFRRRLPQICV